MKKTDGLTRAIGILMFAAMLCYLGFAVVRRVTDQTRTAPAVETTLSLSADMSGLVVRQELVIQSEEEYINVTAAEGQKLAAGETIATVYGTREALDRAAEMNSIARELSQSEEQARQTESGGAAYGALAALAAAVQEKDMTAVESSSQALSEAVLGTKTADQPESYVAALQERYDRLAAVSARETSRIGADCAGVFSRYTDGYEDVSGDSLAGLTPAKLLEYMNEERSGNASALGKLVSEFQWYYAALMDEDDAARLTEGEEVQLRFARYSAGSLKAQVSEISAPRDGQSAVVFVLDEGLADLLSARKTAAELVFESYEGIRIPREGLYRYWACYVNGAEAERLKAGQSVTLKKGVWSAEVTVSEIGEADGDGDCLAVLCWRRDGENVPEISETPAAIVTENAELSARDYYTGEEQYNRLCVFTMTGLQAERKKAELIYEGEDYVLLQSSGEDALRAGNEVILQSETLYDGRVFD